VAAFPVRIRVPYERIEPLRLRRIQLGLALAWRILNSWQAGRRSRDEIPRAELARQLREILFCIARRLRRSATACACRRCSPPLRERLNALLLRQMRHAAEGLTADIAAQKSR